MLRFVGLRPKLYSFDYEREAHFDCEGEEVDKPTDSSVTRMVLDNKVTAKGVKASVAKKLSFGDYDYCLNSLLPKSVEIRRIWHCISIKCLLIAQKRLDCLLLTVKDGYAMMLFRRLHLGTGKR